MATDAEIRAAGSLYIPQQKYLQSPYQLPTKEEEVTEPVPGGITNTNAFTNSGGGGGGGALQTGDPMMNFGNYFDYTRDKYMNSQKTPNVDMNYNQKLQSNFMGMPSYRQQELTGPDLGEYIGGQEIGYTPGGELGFSYGTEVPLEQTTAGKIQSGLQTTGRSIKNLMGMLPTPSSFLNRLGIQNFNSLSPADQAFIQMNSGYRGPTIFGENTTGISKDPFGRNVESLTGNYAQKVRDDFDKLSTNLSSTGVIGKKDQYQGATFDPVTGTFTADDEDEKSIAAAKHANQMNKYNLSRYRFDKKAIAQQKQNQKIAIENEKNAGAAANAGTQRGGGAGDSSTSHMGGISQSQADAVGKANKDAGMGGWGLKDGGRAGYFFGGRVNFKNGGLVSIL